MRYTKYTLQKIETIFKELDYVLRYERGNFQSGYCIVENRKIVVVNKFFDTQSRINTLLEILNLIEVDPSLLSKSSSDVYNKIFAKSHLSKKSL